MLDVLELEQLNDGEAIICSNISINNLCFDSRLCKENDAFFCFVGGESDGHKYIDQAIKNGAGIIVSENSNINKVDGISYIFTTNSRLLYAKASYHYFKDQIKDLKIIGITGTDGKSSTAYYTYQLLKSFNYKCAMFSTVYTDDGTGLKLSEYSQSTPDAFYMFTFLAESAKNKVDFFIQEATSHALSEKIERLYGIEYISSAYTAVSSEHLEFHKTIDNYYKTKARLQDKTKGSTFVYENNKILPYLKNNNLTILPELEFNKQSLKESTFTYNGCEYSFNLGYKFALENAFLAASITSYVLKINICDVLLKINELNHAKGRMQEYKYNGATIIIDFAHTANSFYCLFSQLKKMYPGKNIISVFSSSGQRDKEKRYHMAKVADKYSSTIILSEDDPRNESFSSICDDLLKGIENPDKVIIIEDRKEAIKKALEKANEDTIICLLGKGHQMSMYKGSASVYYSEEETLLKLIECNG